MPHTVLSADLGTNVAAFTARSGGDAVAVINTAAATDPEMRTQAAVALVTAGLDAGQILGALAHGTRS